MPKTRITREIILDAFKNLPLEIELSTYRLAKRLKCEEYQVRAAVSWLVLGGQLRVAGRIKKKDRKGQNYNVKFYRYTGNDKIFRVSRDPEFRQMEKERRSMNVSAVNAFLLPQTRQRF